MYTEKPNDAPLKSAPTELSDTHVAKADARAAEDCLADTDRDPVEVLAEEFVERQRHGECPSIEEYATKHPELADGIRELFPAIVAMERLKYDKEKSSGERTRLEVAQLEQLGDYRLLREIGRGGMGIVYEAEQKSLGRHVAVKILPRQLLLDEKHLKRFQREAQTAANLHHTNIVPVFGVGHQDGYHYYVMQLIDGTGLDELLDRSAHGSGAEAPQQTQETAAFAPALSPSSGGLAEIEPSAPSTDAAPPKESAAHRPQHAAPSRLPKPGSAAYWPWVAHIGAQVAEALEFAHEQGVLHRDIKPANLLLDSSNVVWVADFGLAKALELDDVSRTGDLVGTLRYMAPEQLSGQADAQTDVYSLGLTLYELCVLQPAYNEADRNRLLRRITEGQLEPPRNRAPAIPRDLETIILKAVAHDPARRYSSAGELADDLHRFVGDLPIQARRASSVERLWRWCRRNRAVAALSGTALVLLVLVAVVASAAYVNTRAANREVSNALAGEKAQREKAEATSLLALEALDEIFEQFAPNRAVPVAQATIADPENSDVEVPVQPVLSKETAALLESLLRFYDQLAEQSNHDVRLREKVALANTRVGDIQLQLGGFDAANEAYQRAISLYETIVAADPQERFKTEIARIHNQQGRMARSSGEFDDAKQSFLAALAILSPDEETPPDNLQSQYELARTYYLLGLRVAPPPVFVPQNHPPSGRFGHHRHPRWEHPPQGSPPGETPKGPRDSQSVRRPPPPPTPSDEPPTKRKEWPGKWENPWSRRKDDQLAYLQQAVELLEAMIAQHPAVPDYRYLLACCYREASAGRRPLPQDWNADAKQKAVVMLETLVDEFPQVADYRFALSETYAAVDFFGPFMPAQGLAETEERLRTALGHSVQLVATHPNVPDYLASQVHIRLRLADVLSRQARGIPGKDRDDLLKEAKTELQKAVRLQLGLVQRHPEIASYRIWLAISQRTLAGSLLDLGSLQNARELLESATSTLSDLSQRYPEDQFVHGPLHDGYKRLAEVYRALDEDELSAEAKELAEFHRGKMPFGRYGFRRSGEDRGGGRSPTTRKDSDKDSGDKGAK